MLCGISSGPSLLAIVGVATSLQAKGTKSTSCVSKYEVDLEPLDCEDGVTGRQSRVKVIQ